MTTGANVPDIKGLVALFNAIPLVKGKPGHPCRRPDRMQCDRGYDSEPRRQGLRELGVELVLAERGA